MTIIKQQRQTSFHMMLLPGVILTLIYCYMPILGNVMAFQKFMPNKGFIYSQWVGLENFKYIFALPEFNNVLFNTVFIASMKIIAGFIVSIVISLLINEIINTKVKRTIQTMIYLPYFLSWVILGGILVDILSSNGLVNRMLGILGVESIFFLGDNRWFPFTLVITDVWKNFGFNTVLFLAAMTNINITQYEAAIVDGAGYFKRAIHITLPGIAPIVILISLLSLGNLLNAGFDQIFNMYNPLVMSSGDIVDTYVYRIGIVHARYDLATAVGLFKSVISFIMISVSYYLSYKYANYRIF